MEPLIGIAAPAVDRVEKAAGSLSAAISEATAEAADIGRRLSTVEQSSADEARLRAPKRREHEQ